MGWMNGWSPIVALLAVGAVAGTVEPAPADHSGDRDCGDFSTQSDAQSHMNAHPGDPDGLDGNDQDGRACESNPCPCDPGTGTGADPAPTATPTPTATPSPTRRTRRYRARIVRIIDGDTIKVRLRKSRSRKTVRLIGIDSPETRKPGVGVECGGRRATRYMKRQALRRRRGRRVGERVRLTTDPSQARVDEYGRLLAYVKRRRDGRDLGRALIRAGWAMAHVHDDTPFRRFRSYTSAQEAARDRNRGVWKRCDGDFHSER